MFFDISETNQRKTKNSKITSIKILFEKSLEGIWDFRAYLLQLSLPFTQSYLS